MKGRYHTRHCSDMQARGYGCVCGVNDKQVSKGGYLPRPHMMNCLKCKNQTPHELVGTHWKCLFCAARINAERTFKEDREKLTKPLTGTQVDLFGQEEK